ncbi:alcohol dehydrogenase catalytic domain-containing protein [Labrys wisconsinensis]|uniref:Threonine dehydrogenase-like Zn-dependent dehydrogenase n=1 Tax=Labrys wisconsinensis TaxID=425677 RepID=A0ABU0J6H7_9HYPH|nr:alcohol dehydrogenase catalytic domain-containing protein [Labrys wisconsinensis]MDQ0469869.1 threonine dehydrogenase-like Zn-dependent dehydrogenase [Labrys wisconsinensis]
MGAGPANRWWPLSGAGLEHFGRDGGWIEGEVPKPGAGDLLAGVEAVTICASDAKMVRLGADYPLFGGRDLAREPVCLGHELALRVDEPGSGVDPGLRPGTRIGVQPDVYKHGRRSCIGVTRPGGMADRILLDAEVLQSDDGPLVFPVPAPLSRAATALLEPLGCIEGAFRPWGRDAVRPGGRLVVLCADPRAGWMLDAPLPAGTIDLVGLDEPAWRAAGGPATGRIRSLGLDEALADAGPVDDCLVLGPVDPRAVGRVYDRLASGGTFTWLSPVVVEPGVPADLAHFHYGKLTQRGARSLRLSEAWARPIRCDYRPGGRLLLFGASGAMGRMHLMRAIEAAEGPAAIVALARRADKLAALVAELRPLAEARRLALHAVASDGPDWQAELAALAPGGFDDVVVVAPGDEPMRRAIPFLARNGLLIGFAGTRAGEVVDLPLGRLVTDGISITASSGSTVSDQQAVIRRILQGTLTPERLIAAVGGFPAMRDGVRAVLEGRFSGKVMIMPALDWPLMSLAELFEAHPQLRSLAGPGQSWSKAIEDTVLDG